MPTQLLTTKFYTPPPPPTLIPRTRLCARLSAGRHGKLTLISAPAGFGKTTVVSEWLAQAEKAVAWLSLSEDESEINRFLAYLIGALQRVAPTIDMGVVDVLQSPQAPPIETILTALLNQLAVFPHELILVLDDYHLVEAPTVDRALAFLLDHMPPHLHVLLTTREDPNLPLARWRARGQLTEVRASDLRFTAEEAAAFLNQMMGLNLTRNQVSALESRTEGWIAGLHLAALSLQGHTTAGSAVRAAFVQSFTGSNRFVMDYLVEEVLEQQPPAIQHFLLSTAILDRLCAPLCDAVLGDATAAGQATLETLEQANLFLIPLDNQRHWYRYHHLFAELLRQRLHQSTVVTPAQVQTYHRRASLWFGEQNLQIDALRHALAATDFERAATLLEQIWRAMDDSRQTARWCRWVEQLPANLFANRPVLSAAYGWALLERADLDTADYYLSIAERWLATPTDNTNLPTAAEPLSFAEDAEFQVLPATVAAARTYYALACGDLVATKRFAQQTLDLLPPDSYLRRGVPASLLGLAHWTDGALELACRTFAEGMTNFHRAGNRLFAITGAYILGEIKRAQGRLREAEQIYQQWLPLVADQGELVRRGGADIYTGLSEVACEQGNLTAAAAYLQQSKEWGAQAPLPRWRYRWSLAQANRKWAEGALDAALTYLDEAEQSFVPGPVPDLRPIGARRAQLWIAQNRLTEATAWAHSQRVQAGDHLSYLHEFEHITLARLLVARAQSEQTLSFATQAIDLLTRLAQAAEAEDRPGSLIEILIVQALAHAAQDNHTPAHQSLEHALRLAEPEGYITIFAKEGPPMARLLAEIEAKPFMPEYIATLQARLRPATEQKNANKPDIVAAPTDQPLIEPLSTRELEVLQLIAQGLSNGEIAEQLVIALSTVKGHNRVIFGKLQVSRRTEAVARARELGLV